MGRKLELSITLSQRTELEYEYRNNASHAFRQRCRMILLKSGGMSSKEICPIVGISSENQVNKWIKRYQNDYSSVGISILHNAPGQGRKPVFNLERDSERVRAAVQEERQRLTQAQHILEQEMGEKFHSKTLRRFLKNLSADTNGFVGV